LYGRAWNALPAARVVSEMTELVRRFRLEMVDIIDDNFLVDRQRGVDIANGIIESGERFDWCIQTTANFLLRTSGQDVQLMRRSGLKAGCIGAESGSAESLTLLNVLRSQGTPLLH